MNLADSRRPDDPPVDRLAPGDGTDGFAVLPGMALCAMCVGAALAAKLRYSAPAMGCMTAGLAAAVAGLAGGRTPLARLAHRALGPILVLGLFLEATLGLVLGDTSAVMYGGVALIAVIGLAQLFDLGRLRVPLLALMACAFGLVAIVGFWRRDPQIDVFLFQQMGARGLLHGANPYAIRFPSMYPPGTPYYGPGLVDATNHLTFGFPYPPLSLLMVLPAYLASGDVRLAPVVAIAVSACLMAAARPSRWNGVVAALFLLTPRGFFVVFRSWGEPLLALNFSLLMFCALRCPAAMPYALGFFLATKQYTVLAIPLVWLLVDRRNARPDAKRVAVTLLKAGAVVVAINLPFVLWDPGAFFQSVVRAQFLQPFRTDALSYLVWIHYHSVRLMPPWWAPFSIAAVAIGVALRRYSGSPAGFAAALTLVNLLFFVFNKQAFPNYYYFVIVTAWWAVAAARLEDVDLPAVPVPWRAGPELRTLVQGALALRSSSWSIVRSGSSGSSDRLAVPPGPTA